MALQSLNDVLNQWVDQMGQMGNEIPEETECPICGDDHERTQCPDYNPNEPDDPDMGYDDKYAREADE